MSQMSATFFSDPMMPKKNEDCEMLRCLFFRWNGWYGLVGGQSVWGFTMCECTSVDCRPDGAVCRRRDSDSVVMTQGRQC